MTALSVFTFRTTEVRTVDVDGQIWFVASDIAKALEYAEAKDMTRALDEDEKGRHLVPTPSGDQEMIVINESGLYHALIKSRKPEAQPFRKWVTSEVLPAIRKTGSYEAKPTIAPRTRKALPGGLTIDQQDAIKALVRSRTEALPKDKQAKAAITLWSSVNAKFGTKGKKDGYKHIPAEQFGEVLSLVARVPLEGELLPAGEPVIPPGLADVIARRTHELAMGQYGVIRRMIEERVVANLKCGAKPQELVQVVADFGGCTEESVLVNTWDLVQLSRVVATALNAAGGALSTIQKFEQTYGVALYQRAFDDRLPPQLLQVLLGNHKENIRGVF